MGDGNENIARKVSVRPYVGFLFDADDHADRSGPRIGAEGGYFLKMREDKELEKSTDITGIDFLVFGETDPTKGSLWTTGSRFRLKKDYAWFSAAIGTGVSVRNASTEKTEIQVGVPMDWQFGFLFDTVILGAGFAYYPFAPQNHYVGEFMLGTDLFKVFAPALSKD